MIENFEIIKPEQVNENAIKLIARDWLLITAGNQNSFNTMTASWGGLGFLWNKPVVFIFIRPQRYTYNFVEKEEFFTIQVFEKKYRDILNFCGSHSGRDVNKIEKTGLRPFNSENGNIYFEQASIQMECRKLYFDDIDPERFLDKELLKNYPKNDFHRMYVGEITECLQKKG